MITIKADNVDIPVKQVRFSDGASNLQLLVPTGFIPKSYMSITVDPTTPCDEVLWEVLLARSAVKNYLPGVETLLTLKYLPNARADRAFEAGNIVPLHVFMQAIYPLFDTIFLTDPHSDYVKTLFGDKLNIKEQYSCFLDTMQDIQSGDVIVSPDKGSLAKCEKLQQKLSYKYKAVRVVVASKKRDTATGKIIETTLPEDCDVVGKRCIIVDDILDGGGTFIPLAFALREAGAASVELYVTHGIFAGGLDIFKNVIDKLHVYQVVSNYVTDKQIKQFNEENNQ